MGKKKKTYVKPEMKIIEVKTEGVIAASGAIEIQMNILKIFWKILVLQEELEVML